MLFQAEKLFQKDQQRAYFSRLGRKIFLEDWLTKLVALGITLALWFGVTGLREPITTRFNNISLQPRLSNNLEITNTPVTEVSLVVTGDRRRIDQIRTENMIVSVDLTDVMPGEQTIFLTPETVNVELPTGVKLEEIQPSRIALTLEAVEVREIPVRVETEGSVAENFEVYATLPTPVKVRVRGPSSFIKSLEFVATEKINLDGRQASFTAQQVPLNIINPKVTKLDTAVDVAFRIGEKRIERLFLVPVLTEDGSFRRVQVILYGAASLLASITQENLAENLRVELVKTDNGETKPRAIPIGRLEGKVEIREEPKLQP